MRIARSAILCVAAIACAGVAPVGSSFHPIAQLRGAWTLTEASFATGDTTITNASPQPGLVLFTERHYSLMYVEGSASRTPFANPLRPTDAEKLAAFDTFVGHSGTYSVVDSLIEMQVVIAKNPSLMGADLRTSFARFAYRVQGDTLWLTRRGAAGTFRMKLVRTG